MQRSGFVRSISTTAALAVALGLVGPSLAASEDDKLDDFVAAYRDYAGDGTSAST